ncbi:8285_t:CDS:2, partial [Paraglomus occultum]
MAPHGQLSSDPWSPTSYSTHAHFVPAIPSDSLITILSPLPTDVIIDLGCGDGVLTLEIQSLCSRVIGLDKSENMILAARERGAREAEVVSAENLEEWVKENKLEGKIDKIFSNAALHWMKDHNKVFAGMAAALKPGGRIVAEFGGAGNISALEQALIEALDKRGYDGKTISPWNFAHPETLKPLLLAHGLNPLDLTLFPRPTILPTTLHGWLDTFGFTFCSVLSEDEKVKYKDEVVAVCREKGMWDEDKKAWVLAYV